LSQLCRTGALDFNVSKIGSYWGPHVEVDLVALDEEHHQAILGECKYHVRPVDVDVLKALEAKASDIPELKAYQHQFLLFSKSGFTDRLLEMAENRSQVVLVDRMEIIRSESLKSVHAPF
jgi:hypothetical protein